MSRSLVFVCLLITAVAQALEVPRMPTAPRPALHVTVNCNQHESIQAAVDASAAPVEILITGVCVENVLIRNRDVSLRGAQGPSLDGIRSADPATPALTVRGTVIAAISDLSFSASAGTAVAIRDGARIDIANSRFENNGQDGLSVDSRAFVRGESLTFTGNPGTNTLTSDAQFFCTACDFNGGGAAAVSLRGSIVSLLDSAVTGDAGIIATEVGAFADFDCASLETSHPCSMNVAGPAAVGAFGSTARLFGAGPFFGQLIADDRGTVRLDGAVQRLSSVDGQPNIADNLGEIIVSPLSSSPGLVRTTAAAHFARVVLTGNTTLSGSIQCSGAADAFLDPTVIRLPGSSVTGCDHGGVR